MRYVADRFVVILDANVLYPFRKRDVLLRFYQAGLFRARWSEQILDEWTRNLLKNRPDLENSVRSQLQAMDKHFPEALVTGHMALVDALMLPDMDDRHVLAAAIVCGAQHIVTENLSDFPEDRLAEYDIEAIDADEFLHAHSICTRPKHCRYCATYEPFMAGHRFLPQSLFWI